MVISSTDNSTGHFVKRHFVYKQLDWSFLFGIISSTDNFTIHFVYNHFVYRQLDWSLYLGLFRLGKFDWNHSVKSVKSLVNVSPVFECVVCAKVWYGSFKLQSRLVDYISTHDKCTDEMSSAYDVTLILAVRELYGHTSLSYF